MSEEVVSVAARVWVEHEVRGIAAEIPVAIDPPAISWSGFVLSFVGNQEPKSIDLSIFDLEKVLTDSHARQLVSSELERRLAEIKPMPSDRQESHATR